MRSMAARATLAGILAFFLSAGDAGAQAEVIAAHGFSMHGDLKYPPDFTHFEYADPDAIKGGSVSFSSIGSFDNLNPYILKGSSAAGLSLTFDTLSVQSGDEPFSEYGLIAETIIMPEDRSWVAFELRPEARWHDGEPITVEDVIWSLETLKSEGHPFYRAYYKNVASAEKEGERRVRFTFEGGVNRELPLIIGQMPILPRHVFENRPFNETTLEPITGSGPYRIRSVDPGRSIVYERVSDYWAADLPVNKGRHNFDELRYEYFRDSDIALEAFKAGQYDIRIETTAKLWATGYESPAVESGLIVMEEIADESGNGMQAYAMNSRRELFTDPRVRKAIAYAFDFEWTNANFFYDAYARTNSYFVNTELAARELPGPLELELLEPHRDRLPPEVFTEIYNPPSTDGSGNLRANLKTAFELLQEAGWTIDPNTRKLIKDGRLFEFEILLVNPAFERITGPFIQNLERLGMRATMRTVDSAQYQRRLDSFDFDMTVAVWGQSLSPGNEQRDFWSCEARDTPGSRNYLGVCDPLVDELITRIIQAPSREDLVATVRALDRVLLWNHHVVPHWHSRTTRIAYWDKLERPAVSARYGLDLFSWWVDPDKAAALAQERPRG